LPGNLLTVAVAGYNGRRLVFPDGKDRDLMPSPSLLRLRQNKTFCSVYESTKVYLAAEIPPSVRKKLSLKNGMLCCVGQVRKKQMIYPLRQA